VTPKSYGNGDDIGATAMAPCRSDTHHHFAAIQKRDSAETRDRGVISCQCTFNLYIGQNTNLKKL
jgi:hypothetical protein